MSKDLLYLTGSENFSEIIEKGAYAVDKTAYLKTMFLSSYEVKNLLFIHTRRFGKTINMDMIKEFCEISYQHPKDKSYQQKLFQDNGRNLTVHEALESSEGDTSLVLEKFNTRTCCILELKKAKSLDKYYDAAQEGTAQIIKKNYAAKFIGKRYKKVYGIGIGFPKNPASSSPWAILPSLHNLNHSSFL